MRFRARTRSWISSSFALTEDRSTGNRRGVHPTPTRNPQRVLPVPSPPPCPHPNTQHPTTHTSCSCTSSRCTVFCCAPTGGRGKGLPSRDKTRGRTAQGSGRVDQLRQVVDVWGCGHGSRGKGHLHDQADAAGDVHNESGWYSQGAEEERLLWP